MVARNTSRGGRRKPGELTDQQKNFVREYLVDLNGRQAAIRAGYAPLSAEASASQLLSVPKVANALAVEQAKLAARTEVNQERIIREYARIAFADIRSFSQFDDAGIIIRPSDDLSADDAAAVAEVSETVKMVGKGEDAHPVRTVKIKLHDKLRALEALGRHLGLDAPIQVAIVRQEAERIAAEFGLSVEDVLAEAESAVRAHAVPK